jgi:hypothetical protein
MSPVLRSIQSRFHNKIEGQDFTNSRRRRDIGATSADIDADVGGPMSPMSRRQNADVAHVAHVGVCATGHRRHRPLPDVTDVAGPLCMICIELSE